MKFSDYKKNTRNEKNDGKQYNASQEKIIKNFLSRYEGKSRSELIDEIAKVAEKNRKEGNLKNSDLDDFAEMITPYLTKEQKTMLSEVLSNLKKT